MTICTQNKTCFLGDITNSEIRLSKIGIVVEKYWYEIPEHFPFVNLGAFVVMPNHVHGIVVIDKTVETRQCLVSTNATSANAMIAKTMGQKRVRNQGRNTLSSIVGSYKSVVTRHGRKITPDFAWQSRFYDHIIRDEKLYEKISEYIIYNPLNWGQDDNYV